MPHPIPSPRLSLTLTLAISSLVHAFGTYNNTNLVSGSRWDSNPRNINGLERSLSGGLRYSLQGGSYQAYRDMFSWSSLPSVPAFQAAIDNAFAAWTVTDPYSGFPSTLSFTPDLATPVATGNANGARLGCEIDLFGATSGSTWGVGNTGTRAETFFSGISTTIKLTSGTTNYSSVAIGGADVTFNSNPGAVYNLTTFQTILTHELGHALGLADVDVQSGPGGTFIDDNYNPASNATALATLTNPFAHLVNAATPSASPFNLYTVANGSPGIDSPGVDILMETSIPNSLFNASVNPLRPDDFAGRQFLYPSSVPQWRVDAGGSYGTLANWSSNAAPDSPGAAAIFGSYITAPRTVTLGPTRTLGSLTFANPNAYTLSGGSTLNFDTGSASPATILVTWGQHRIESTLDLDSDLTITINALPPAVSVPVNGNSLTITSPVVAAGHSITKNGPGKLTLPPVTLGSLTLAAGPTQIDPIVIGRSQSTIDTLTIAPGATLDLTTTSLATGTNATTLRQYLFAHQILSSGADPDHVLGYIPSDANILIRLATPGDANLDGLLNPDDFTLTDNGFHTAGSYWFEGDFNYDGSVNSADYLILDSAYARQQGGSVSSDLLSRRESQFGPDYVTSLLTSVPEPTLPLLTSASCILIPLRHRRPRIAI